MDFVELKDAANIYSFDMVGVADPFCYELQRGPRGHRPQDYLPGVKSVISLGMKIIDSMLQTTPSGIYSKHYDAVNERLNAGAYDLTRWLEEQGYPSMTFPETDSYAILWSQYKKGYSGFVPCFNHMAAAVAAGMGKMGVCGVVLTRMHGPRQRWITVLTEAAIPYDAELTLEICLDKKGEECLECVQACKIDAISTIIGTNVRDCWIRWTDLREMGMACGQCIKACPVGRSK